MASKPVYQIKFSQRAEKDFAKFDRPVQKFLIDRLSKLEKSADPLKNAARLVNFKNLYRHRFGDYRIIFTIEKNGKIGILLILKVAHRRDIYQQLA